MTDHKDARQLLADITADGKTVFEQFADLASLRGALAVHMVHTPVENVRAITDLVAAQAQRIAELEAERQWQPIDTAPKRAKVLVGCFKPVSQFKRLYGHIEVDSWDEQYAGFGRFNARYWPATHWMPLPASPHEGAQ